ncbi:MAG: amino acid ABC transporter substrate-binding protein [Acidobacteriota bacterium]
MSSPGRRTLCLLACLVSASFAAGCGRSDQAAESTATLREIRLGAVLPLTGKESKIGGAFHTAIRFAVDEANGAGGLQLAGRRIPIALEILDDTTDTTRSAQLIEQLITQSRVHAVVGGYSTILVQAQSVVPDRYGIPYINGGGASSSIYGRSSWVFGTLAPVDQLAATQMEFLRDLVDGGRLPKPTRISLLWENTEHGKDYQRGVRQSAAQSPDHFQVIVDEGFELYAHDFKPLLTRVHAASADVFMADARLEDYISMHRQYTQMGLHHKMTTYGPRGADKAARDGLGAATDFIFASSWWSPNLPYPQVEAFNQKYSAATGATPAWYDALAYETVRALLRAIEAAGSVAPDAIRSALAAVALENSLVPGGTLKFNSHGQAVYPFVVTQNKPQGKLDLVWPKGDRTGDTVCPVP